MAIIKKNGWTLFLKCILIFLRCVVLTQRIFFSCTLLIFSTFCMLRILEELLVRATFIQKPSFASFFSLALHLPSKTSKNLSNFIPSNRNSRIFCCKNEFHFKVGIFHVSQRASSAVKEMDVSECIDIKQQKSEIYIAVAFTSNIDTPDAFQWSLAVYDEIIKNDNAKRWMKKI